MKQTFYETLHIRGRTYTCVVTIDSHKLALDLVPKALRNKSGQTSVRRGAVTGAPHEVRYVPALAQGLSVLFIACGASF
jgi:hypothetical protein